MTHDCLDDAKILIVEIGLYNVFINNGELTVTNAVKCPIGRM